MKEQELTGVTLPRSSSTKKMARSYSTHIRSHSSLPFESESESDKSLSGELIVHKQYSPLSIFIHPARKLSSLFHCLLNDFSFSSLLPTFKWLSLPTNLPVKISSSHDRKVTGTLFGHRYGLVNFAVQLNPRSEPILLLELAISTATLVREMSTGLIRIALECEKLGSNSERKIGLDGRPRKLLQEPKWTMYCKGRKCGHAVSRTCRESDRHVLSTLQNVSAGAGVIPVLEDGSKSAASEGEFLFMRANYERVVGGRDSEAFYMMNPDGNYGGPELSIFLLRI